MQAMKGKHKSNQEKLIENIKKDVSNCDPKTECLVEFAKQEEDCVENCDILNVEVNRKGNQSCRVEIKWKVISEDAEEGVHFSLDRTSMIFEKDVQTIHIPVTIVDDNDKNPDRHFQLHITEVTIMDGSDIKAKIGDVKNTRITVLDDDIPG